MLVLPGLGASHNQANSARKRKKEYSSMKLRIAKLIGAFVTFLVAGCASQIMSGYIGQSLQEAMLDYGTPVNAFDMPDGSRAFQWVLTSSYVLPTTITQSGNAQASGNNLNWMSNTRITGGQPVTNTCAYTMLARWVDASNAWIFYDFRKPRFGCE
jgi:hypothetical protein